MITLLHGENIEASRAEYNRLKDAIYEKELLDGKVLDETNLTQAISSGSMFGGEKTVFIDNLFGKLGRKTTRIEKLATIIRESVTPVVLWEDKEVGITVLRSLGKADVKLFKIPQNIFQFLDTLTAETYNRVSEPPELVLFLLSKRIRQLIQIRDEVTPEGLQGWQASKLTRQAKLFTMDRLLFMYKKLLDMEFSIKNGTSPFMLKELTEQFLIDL